MNENIKEYESSTKRQIVALLMVIPMFPLAMFLMGVFYGAEDMSLQNMPIELIILFILPTIIFLLYYFFMEEKQVNLYKK